MDPTHDARNDGREGGDDGQQERQGAGEERREAWWSPTLTRVRPDGSAVELRLLRPLVVEGFAVTADGLPVAGASARAQDSWRQVSATSDAAGRSALPLDPATTGAIDVELFADDPSGAMLYGAVTCAARPPGTLRVVLQLHDGIIGR